MNARNLLIGIGIVAVVTGGVLGSGALTQVTAERTATVTTADDTSSALVGINVSNNVDPSYVASADTDDDGAIQFDFSGLNENATTTMSAINVTNNLNEDMTLTVKVDGTSNWLSIDGANGVPLNSGDTKEVNVVINTSAASSTYTDATINVTATTSS